MLSMQLVTGGSSGDDKLSILQENVETACTMTDGTAKQGWCIGKFLSNGRRCLDPSIPPLSYSVNNLR